MIRELVMAAICVLAVIALAWLMDHPKKELGAGLALAAFVGMIVVAYVKKRNRARQLPPRFLHRDHEPDEGLH